MKSCFGALSLLVNVSLACQGVVHASDNPIRTATSAAIFSGIQPRSIPGQPTGNDADPARPAVDTDSAARALLYDNGPLATGDLSDSGVAAPSGYLWSELQIDPANPSVGNTLLGISGGLYSGVHNRLADDFTVPAGQSWTLTEAEIVVYQNGHIAPTSPVEQATLQIWSGPPGNPESQLLCGNQVDNVLQSSQPLGMLRIANSILAPASPVNTRPLWALTIAIPPVCATEDFFVSGTYWMDWSSLAPLAELHFSPIITVPGARGRAADNALRWQGTMWVAVADLGTNFVQPGVPQDLPFKLYGSSSGDDLIFANGFQ